MVTTFNGMYIGMQYTRVNFGGKCGNGGGANRPKFLWNDEKSPKV